MGLVMSHPLEPVRRLALEVRRYGGTLLAGVPEPHDELMSLVWGPRFDREHALGLLARRPAVALPVLPALLAAADVFDALHGPAQQRLRQLIRRHRALNAPADTASRRLPSDIPVAPPTAAISHGAVYSPGLARWPQGGVAGAPAPAPVSAHSAPM